MICPVCHKEHHGLCHQCPHMAEVQAGKYSDMDFGKTPCSACRLADEQRARHVGGGEAVSFDELAATLEDREPEAWGTRLMHMISFALGQILGCGDRITREIVMRRMAGDSLAEIAQAVRKERKTLSVQAVHARIRKAEKQNKSIELLLAATKNKKGKGKHDEKRNPGEKHHSIADHPDGAG